MVANIRGIAKEYSIATLNPPHAVDQQVYTVTVYDNSNINIQTTYADQSGYKTSFVTLISRQEVLNSTDCDPTYAVMSAAKDA